MAKPLTPEERERCGYEAWKLSSRGMSAPEIAERLTTADFSISEKTVRVLVGMQARRAASANDTKRGQMRARFEAEQRAVIEDCWQRLALQDPEALNKGITDAQANITAASVNIARAHGLFVDRKVTEVGGLDGRPIRVKHEHSAFDFDAFRAAFADVLTGSGPAADRGDDPS